MIGKTDELDRLLIRQYINNATILLKISCASLARKRYTTLRSEYGSEYDFRVQKRCTAVKRRIFTPFSGGDLISTRMYRLIVCRFVYFLNLCITLNIRLRYSRGISKL